MENKKLDNQIIVTDSEGHEHVMEILFTYEHPERKTSYVFFFDPIAPEEIIAMRYNQAGELEEIDDDDEYAEVEEVFNAFQQDPTINEA
ncbi:MAG: DUF1292 domain-containing protein [Erysipelotrichaceae bacterium]|jgi:uncharacterized protein YrzB (UPF0473 family)|nr:DUF1292 domain-containing protein [Erysipelotrichaceae bacterium]